MDLRTWGLAALLFAAGVAAPAPSNAQQLYAASVRSIAEGSGPEGQSGGSLYSVQLAGGSATFIAPIRLNGTVPIGITGLAAHRTSGVIYGITSPLSRNAPVSLVTVDPTTGNATLIGPMIQGGSDISFNRAGILFTWLPQTSQLGTVNLDTGVVTPIGTARAPGPPAGLAIDDKGTAYVTPKGATGTIDTVDIATGTQTTGPPLTGAPFDSTINSMTFTPSGLLLAVNSNAGSPSTARLVTINVSTGVVSNIGNLPDDTDGLAFSNTSAQEASKAIDWRTLALYVLATIGAILGFIGWLVGKRAK
jgi:hypothetical protein